MDWIRNEDIRGTERVRCFGDKSRSGRFLVKVQWKDSEGINWRMLRSKAARPVAGPREVRARRFMDGAKEEDVGSEVVRWRRVIG